MSLMSLKGLSVDLDVGNGSTKLVHPIDFDVQRGEAVGMVGESGSGKTLTWLAALGLHPAGMRVSGKALLDGRDMIGLDDTALSRIRGRRIAMIFQDPASGLNPVHRIGRQLGEILATHRGLSGSAIDAEARRLLDAVGIADAARRLRQYPHEFSGGMNQRVMIAMALAGAPDLLIADEPTTALDVTIQAQILDLLATIRRDTGMAMVFISHDLGVVAEVCDRIVVMLAGQIVEDAPVDRIFDAPGHPYTRELLSAYAADEAGSPIQARERYHDSMDGCAFTPRCTDVDATCLTTRPALHFVANRHRAACIRPLAAMGGR